MPLSRRKFGEIQRSAWLSSPDFVKELSKHVGQELQLRWKKGRNVRVTVVSVSGDSVSFEKDGHRTRLSIRDVDGFTTADEWWNHRKSRPGSG